MTDNIRDLERRLSEIECWAAATQAKDDERWRAQGEHNKRSERSMEAIKSKLTILAEKVTQNTVRLTLVMSAAVTIGSIAGAALARYIFPS